MVIGKVLIRNLEFFFKHFYLSDKFYDAVKKIEAYDFFCF